MLRGRRRHDCADQVRQWIGDSGRPAPSREQLLAVRQPIAEGLLVHAAPMPGAPDLVQHCAAEGIPMAMATSSSKAAVELKASPHPWLSLIAVRVHGDDPQLKRGKPAPDVFLLAAERLGVQASGCWAFEDSPAGVQAAAAAGCLVHVLPPDHLNEAERQLLYPGMERFLSSLADVLGALQ
jgi:HAD superfamily hydrolase (TIGR01509 family)